MKKLRVLALMHPELVPPDDAAERDEKERFDWKTADTFSAPVFAHVEHHAHGDSAFVVRIHDEPLQRGLGFYEESE